MQFIRYVTPERDARTGQPTGLMSFAYDLLRSDELGPAEDQALRRHVAWIEENLPVPSRFARKRNVSHKETHGLSWLKAEATEAVRQLRAVAEILRSHGHPIETRLTTRPGYVVYEDELQIVAEPFHGEAV